MKKKSVLSKQRESLTPSSLRLMKLVGGRGPGMLSVEEIELLRLSKKEIAEVCRNARQSKYDDGIFANALENVADNTDLLASLEATGKSD